MVIGYNISYSNTCGILNTFYQQAFTEHITKSDVSNRHKQLTLKLCI